MSFMLLSAGGLQAHTAFLFLAAARLRLVIVPCLDSHKTPARGGPLRFYHGLLGIPFRPADRATYHIPGPDHHDKVVVARALRHP